MLKDLIRETRYREATDPKDKIYSLYGLMGDHMNEYLKPNYSLSVAEVEYISHKYSLNSCVRVKGVFSNSAEGVREYITPFRDPSRVFGLPFWLAKQSTTTRNWSS
jgi:hypothetical protein